MKPINAEEIVRVFNGWLEEADSLAEREAIECCIDHIQDAPAVSQQELRSYMLPWFSPFEAPWCGKIQRAFPKAYVTMNFELILVPRTNTYINLNHCSTPDEFKAEVIEGVSRFAFKGFTKPLCREHLDGINKLLDTHGADARGVAGKLFIRNFTRTHGTTQSEKTEKFRNAMYPEAEN